MLPRQLCFRIDCLIENPFSHSGVSSTKHGRSDLSTPLIPRLLLPEWVVPSSLPLVLLIPRLHRADGGRDGGAGVPCTAAGAAGTCCQTNPGFGIGRLTACGVGGAGGGGSKLGCDLSDCGGVLDLRDLPRSLLLRRSLDLELSELLLRLRRSPILNGNPHGFGNMILRAPALFSHTQFRAPAQWLGKQPASHCKV